jgi:hypothetical protein
MLRTGEEGFDPQAACCVGKEASVDLECGDLTEKARVHGRLLLDIDMGHAEGRTALVTDLRKDCRRFVAE